MAEVATKERIAEVTDGQNCATPMPLYDCHKQVWALKIKAVEIVRPTIDQLEAILNTRDTESDPIPGGIITPVEQGFGAFFVSKEFMDKHDPQVGGYYVVYKDGYKSFSPAGAFEEGYTRVSGKRGK
jgi:hypothetical protein